MGKHKQTYKPGNKAPDFTATDVKGKEIRLSDYKEKSVLLVFLRYSGCPWCNLTIHRLALEYPMLKRKNCEIIAFIQSDVDSIKANIYSRHTVKPQFPILADQDKEFYNLYGIKSSPKAALKSLRHLPSWTQAVMKHDFKQTKVEGDIFLVPATFLVAAHTQKIVKSDYGTSFYELESLFSIYESLEFNEA